MLGAGHYGTGAEVDVFLTDSPRLPDFTQEDPLDVTGVSIVQEGNVLPLYAWAQAETRQFAYATRLVTGALEFNFSPNQVRRLPGSNPIQESYLWVILTHVTWEPQPQIVRDIYRLSHVWSHPVQHSPDPSAQTVMPFTARGLALIRRQYRAIRMEGLGDLISDGGPYQVPVSDILHPPVDEFRTKVTRVVDGDTFEVEGLEQSVRMLGADTPESSGSRRPNNDNDKDWRWPSARTDHADGADYGAPGKSPTADQLTAWGERIKAYMKTRLEGQEVMLRRDPSADAKDVYDRHLYQVFFQGQDQALFLIRHGMATVFSSESMAVFPDGSHADRKALLDAVYQQAREAGTYGIWNSFDSSKGALP